MRSLGIAQLAGSRGSGGADAPHDLRCSGGVRRQARRIRDRRIADGEERPCVELARDVALSEISHALYLGREIARKEFEMKAEKARSKE